MVSIRAILWAVNVLLVAAVAYASAVMAAGLLERRLAENTTLPAPAVHGRRAQGNDKPKPLSAFQQILDTNMFHAKRSAAGVSVGSKAVPVSLVTTPGAEAAPSDKLPFKLILTGTFITDTGSVAFVIGPDGRTERVYRAKECLPRNDDEPKQECQPNQGALAKIGNDHIVVFFNGASYVVKFEEEKPQDTPAPVASARGPIHVRGGRRTGGPAGRTGEAPAQANAAAFPSTREGDNILMKVPTAEVEKAFENFAGIVNQARVVPFLVNGEPQGFQIRKIVPGSIFERLGLTDADIIKTVNGESLTTADQALRLFTLFRNEREVNLEIVRNNQNLNLSYTIE